MQLRSHRLHAGRLPEGIDPAWIDEAQPLSTAKKFCSTYRGVARRSGDFDNVWHGHIQGSPDKDLVSKLDLARPGACLEAESPYRNEEARREARPPLGPGDAVLVAADGRVQHRAQFGVPSARSSRH
jgi:hypothetical protein